MYDYIFHQLRRLMDAVRKSIAIRPIIYGKVTRIKKAMVAEKDKEL